MSLLDTIVILIVKDLVVSSVWALYICGGFLLSTLMAILNIIAVFDEEISSGYSDDPNYSYD